MESRLKGVLQVGVPKGARAPPHSAMQLGHTVDAGDVHRTFYPSCTGSKALNTPCAPSLSAQLRLLA